MPHPETLAAHAGTRPDPGTGAVTPPIHLATTFERSEDGTYPQGYIYARTGNPTRDLFESSLADLEGGQVCAAFASGMAAADAVFRSLDPGDHVVIPSDAYYGVRHLLLTHFEPWGLRVTQADLWEKGSLERVCESDPRLVWIETPSNPLVRVTDIEAMTAVCRERGIASVVDGTWTTPLLQRPLELGADFVMHSVTKYIGGHSDVLGGAITCRDQGHPLMQGIRAIQEEAGAVMEPFSAWLALRGMRSLGARIARQCATARQLAEFLASHPRVEAVHYPGLPGDPGHAVARRQMTDFGGMLSIRVAGGQREAMAVAARAEIFRRATSLGGTESLIEHRASVEAQPTTTPLNLLRLSIGLEHPDDLQDDLEQALRGL